MPTIPRYDSQVESQTIQGQRGVQFTPEGLGSGAVAAARRASQDYTRDKVQSLNLQSQLLNKERQEQARSERSFRNILVREQEKTNEILRNEVQGMMWDLESEWNSEEGLARREKADALGIQDLYRKDLRNLESRIKQKFKERMGKNPSDDSQVWRQLDFGLDRFDNQAMAGAANQEIREKERLLADQRAAAKKAAFNARRYAQYDPETGRAIGSPALEDAQVTAAGASYGDLADKDPKLADSPKGRSLVAHEANENLSNGTVQSIIDAVEAGDLRFAIKIYDANPDMISHDDKNRINQDIDAWRKIVEAEDHAAYAAANFDNTDNMIRWVMNSSQVPDDLKEPTIQNIRIGSTEAAKLRMQGIQEERSQDIGAIGTGSSRGNMGSTGAWTREESGVLRIWQDLDQTGFAERSDPQALNHLNGLYKQEIIDMGLEGLEKYRSSLSLEDFRAFADQFQRTIQMHREATLPVGGPKRDKDLLELRMRGPEVFTQERLEGQLSFTDKKDANPEAIVFIESGVNDGTLQSMSMEEYQASFGFGQVDRETYLKGLEAVQSGEDAYLTGFNIVSSMTPEQNVLANILIETNISANDTMESIRWKVNNDLGGADRETLELIIGTWEEKTTAAAMVGLGELSVIDVSAFEAKMDAQVNLELVGSETFSAKDQKENPGAVQQIHMKKKKMRADFQRFLNSRGKTEGTDSDWNDFVAQRVRTRGERGDVEDYYDEDFEFTYEPTEREILDQQRDLAFLGKHASERQARLLVSLAETLNVVYDPDEPQEKARMDNVARYYFETLYGLPNLDRGPGEPKGFHYSADLARELAYKSPDVFDYSIVYAFPDRNISAEVYEVILEEVRIENVDEFLDMAYELHGPVARQRKYLGSSAGQREIMNLQEAERAAEAAITGAGGA